MTQAAIVIRTLLGTDVDAEELIVLVNWLCLSMQTMRLKLDT